MSKDLIDLILKVAPIVISVISMIISIMVYRRSRKHDKYTTNNYKPYLEITEILYNNNENVKNSNNQLYPISNIQDRHYICVYNNNGNISIPAEIENFIPVFERQLSDSKDVEKFKLNENSAYFYYYNNYFPCLTLNFIDQDYTDIVHEHRNSLIVLQSTQCKVKDISIDSVEITYYDENISPMILQGKKDNYI